MRINKGQEFAIGGQTFGGTMFDALIFGYYEADSLELFSAYSEVFHSGNQSRSDEAL